MILNGGQLPTHKSNNFSLILTIDHIKVVSLNFLMTHLNPHPMKLSTNNRRNVTYWPTIDAISIIHQSQLYTLVGMDLK